MYFFRMGAEYKGGRRRQVEISVPVSRRGVHEAGPECKKAL